VTDTPTGDVVDDGSVADETIVEEAESAAIAVLRPADLGLELPGDPAEAEQVLLSALAASRQESGEYLETMQRLAAEFDNFRKRADRDRTELVQRASQRLITEMLPTLDNFDAALAYEPQTPSEEKILEGMRSTRSQLLVLLESEGLEPIEAEGAPFDPAVHEAVSGPTGEGEGDLIVATELRRGYLLSGRVLRAALVTVEHTGRREPTEGRCD
jgi:molecular chaperone GrpE